MVTDLNTIIEEVKAWFMEGERISGQLREFADGMASGGGRFPAAWKSPVMPVALLPASTSGENGAAKTGRKRRTMSAEAREKIAAAQRARWAKQKGESSGSAKKAKKAKKAKGAANA